MTLFDNQFNNPYVYGAPIHEEHLFFGREKELKEISNAVTKPIKQDIYVLGGRRSGKTSLLFQLERRLHEPFFPVYIPLYEAEPNTENVLEFILYKIIIQLKKRNILSPAFQHRKALSAAYFEERLAQIIYEAQKQIPNVRIVLLIDETDFLLTVDMRVQHILRATLQGRETGANLCAVMVGVTDLSTKISRYASPLFNHFRFVTLKLLTEEETRDLIVSPALSSGLLYAPSAVERIRLLSGGQPYFCQALCYEAFDIARHYEHHKIEMDDVNYAEKKIVENLRDGYRVSYWEQANREEKHFLMSLAQRRLLRHIPRSEVARLIDWQIISEAQEGNYTFTAELFAIWTTEFAKRKKNNG